MGQLSGLAVDPSLQEPLYRQVFDQVVARIRSGAYPPGFRLPPTRTLAKELRTHRNTVVRAYQDLESAGFVVSAVGRGTFVATPAKPQLQVVAGPAVPAGLSWTTLLGRGALAEPLVRADRLARTTGGGGDLIDLTRMHPSPDLLPDELLRRCVDHVLRTLGARALTYAPRDGLPRLRGLIAEDLARQGVPASADDILITTGSQQGLDVLVRTLVNPGEPFLVEEWTYTGVINLLGVAGARMIPVPCDEQGPDPTVLERLSNVGAKGLYVMPNCNNPTGRRTSPARREALLAWSQRAGVPLIEDDYAADLVLDDAPTPAALRALDGDVIYVGTFSKKLMPALRIGFLVCPRALRPHLVPLRHAMDLGSSVLLQHALAEFMERGYLRAHLSRIVPEYRRRRDALQAALAAHLPPAIKWRQPDAGVILWLPMPAPLPPEIVFEEARRAGVLVSPSTLNRVDAPPLGGVRLAFCSQPSERLVEAGRRLGRALRALLKRGDDATPAGATGLGLV